jgi:hypothetical protein
MLLWTSTTSGWNGAAPHVPISAIDAASLVSAEGSALIRLRWYGDGGGAGGVPLPDKEVYVERKSA